MWVGFGTLDAPRRPLKQIDQAQDGSRVALKRLWRELDADAAGFDPE
jgi:hypothetical protein